MKKYQQISGRSWANLCPPKCKTIETVPDMFSRAIRESRRDRASTSAANTQSEEVAGEVAGDVANDNGHTTTAIATTSQGTGDDGNNGGINAEQRARLQAKRQEALERRRLRRGGQSQTVVPDDVTGDTVLADDGNAPANAAALIELADSEASSPMHANR